MDISNFLNNTSNNAIIENTPPQICLDNDCCLGIDEAGRGPVLGPMVYGISYCTIKVKNEIAKLGLADSKTLKESDREDIFQKIEDCGYIGWAIDILSPNFISNSMLKRRKYNLNAISHDSAIGLIRRVLKKGVVLKEVYVDTVGPPEKYQTKLQALFPDIDITVAKKADSTYPIVSAASICAKVSRDLCIKNWKSKEDIELANYGSGYPSDPVTKEFLRNSIDPVFGFSQFVRFSWSTASLLLEKHALSVQWEDDDEDEDDDVPIKQKRMGDFFNTEIDDDIDGSTRIQRHVFYEDARLSQLTTMF